jgi:hypothetical protein
MMPNPGGLIIIDVEDPSSLTLLGSLSLSAAAYCVVTAGERAYVAGKHFWVVDISDISSPTIMGNTSLPWDAYGIRVRDDWVYVTDNSDDGCGGLSTFDVRNPASPELVNYLEFDWASDICFDGDLAYVSDGPDGLRVVDVSNPISPIHVGTFEAPASFWGVSSANGFVYAGGGLHGLWILCYTGPGSPYNRSAVPFDKCRFYR